MNESKYISFEVAMAALQNGKTVSFYDHDWQATFNQDDYIENKELSGFTFRDFFRGTWVIEN
jgi:hypothetical protein